MISLLRKLGWKESGHTEDLDLGDPDLFFYIPRNIEQRVSN